MAEHRAWISGLFMIPAIILCVSVPVLAAGEGAESASVPIEARAQIVSSYAVKADPFLELTWNEERKDYEGIYQVGVRGSIPSDRRITIVPDASFQMTSGTVTRTGTVQQPFTRWAKDPESPNILPLSERIYVSASGTAAIELPGTGVYRGGIDFVFTVE